jgi:CarD family transcriptional regulator
MVDKGLESNSENAQGKAATPQPRFEVGDKAVYPAHGVGEVTGIERRTIGKTNKTFYVLKILDSGMKIMIPTDNAMQVGLRQVISDEQAAEVYDILRAPEVAVDTQPWNRRYREYMEMLKSGSPYEVAKVLRDLYRLKFDKDLSFGERRLLDTARSLLVKELALAKKCEESAVEEDIQQIFDA